MQRESPAVRYASQGQLAKVIIESALRTPLDIIQRREAARDGSAGFVKKSTYHTHGGATAGRSRGAPVAEYLDAGSRALSALAAPDETEVA
jgi:deoxyribose-phosphate aldolase